MSQMFHFQCELDPGTLGVGGGKQILENAWIGEIGVKLDGKKKHKL